MKGNFLVSGERSSTKVCYKASYYYGKLEFNSLEELGRLRAFMSWSIYVPTTLCHQLKAILCEHDFPNKVSFRRGKTRYWCLTTELVHTNI